MTVHVHPVRDEDLSAAIAIIRAGSLGVSDDDPGDLEPYRAAVALTRERGGEVLVVDDGEVVGVCQLIVFRHLQHRGGWCAEVESVHVREDRRDKGYGSQLIEAAESLARERGCYRLQLTSNNVRTDAHRFYERLGFASSHRGFKKELGPPESR